MSKYVKDLITTELQEAARRRGRRAVGERRRHAERTERRAASSAAPEEDQPDGGEEQPGPPGHRRDGARAGFRRRRRARSPSCGAAKTWCRWRRKSSASPALKEFAPFAPQGGVMDGQKLSPDEVTQGQQVAEPPGAAQHFGRPDFERRVRTCRLNCSAPARSSTARSRRRAKAPKKKPQHRPPKQQLPPQPPPTAEAAPPPSNRCANIPTVHV